MTVDYWKPWLEMGTQNFHLDFPQVFHSPYNASAYSVYFRNEKLQRIPQTVIPGSLNVVRSTNYYNVY